MLRLTVGAVGDQAIVAAVQGPNQHYLGAQPGSEPAYNWGIRQHAASAIRLHHEMVGRVLDEMIERFSAPPGRCVLLGFSQPVGLNYRFTGTYPDRIGGVIGICGGVPSDWEEDKYRTFDTPVLHISRDQDEFYPVEVVSRFPERLRVHATNVEFHLIPGAHRFPSNAATILRPWLEAHIPHSRG